MDRARIEGAPVVDRSTAQAGLSETAIDRVSLYRRVLLRASRARAI